MPSDLNAAYLWAQLEKAEEILNDRMASWNLYNQLLKELEEEGYIRLPEIPEECTHNAHMFYIKTKDLEERQNLISFLKAKGVGAVFHYIHFILHRQGRNMGSFLEKISIRHLKVKGY